MKGAKYFFIFCLFFGVVTGAQGQTSKCEWVNVDRLVKGIRLDSLSILPESIAVKDRNQYLIPFDYNFSTGIISLGEAKLSNIDSVHICYQVLPFNLNAEFTHRSLENEYDSAALFKERRVIASHTFDFREEIFPVSTLTKSGNLTRGVSFGNNQHVFMNSSLNLQMEGQLSDNLKVRASITDQNVPFQPEGNTQMLQDFDNVLIELYNDKTSLIAGDVVLHQRRSEFLNYYKNVQGLQFTTQYEWGQKWKASSQIAASIAKGKFASTELPVLEGVLGPYRIRGPQNERFVILLANSERIFLDGRLLKRGFNYDYVIDYNQGEITFTTNVLITHYSRLRVDYEYAERNYSRSILAVNHIQESNQTTLFFNYYKEQDNKERPLFYEFSDEDRRLLASIGNNISEAVIMRIDSTAFDPNRVMYARMEEFDSNAGISVYYQYSTDAEKAFYIPNFTDVGDGKGDYIRKGQLSNGVQYEYVAPLNGIKQGRFAIQTPLAVPTKKEMVTAGALVKLGIYEEVYTEGALSINDVNLYSSLDSENIKGYALKAGVRSRNRVIGWFPGYKFLGLAELEYNSRNFSFVDRVRYIEFDRDWSLSPEEMVMPSLEQLFTAQLEAKKDPNNVMSYRLNLRNRGHILNGYQQLGKLNKQIGNRIYLTNDLFALSSNGNSLTSDWIRYNAMAAYKSKVLVPGYRFDLDRNIIKKTESDSILSTAMNYLEHQLFINGNDTLSYSFFVNATWREDQVPVSGNMVPDTKAFTSHYGLVRKFGKHDLKISWTYRKLSYLREMLPEESTLMGRLDYIGSSLNHNLRSELNYAIGNGRELRREYVYLPVPTGEGTHTWRDDNKDGVQQLNEFYLAINPDEKNFIKIFVPTDDYIQAYHTIYNYRLNAKFPEDWKKKTGVKAFLVKFSNNNSLNVDKKITSSDFWNRVLPFTHDIANDDLISIRQSIRSSLFFNRSSTKCGFDLSLFDSQFKQLLAGGFDDLMQKDWKLNTRYNYNSSMILKIIANTGKRIAASDFLDNRNYKVSQLGYGPEFAYQPLSTFRATANYLYTGKQNMANREYEEKAVFHQVGLDIRYAKAIKTTFNANMNYTFIEYSGQSNSPVGYEMLQALTTGNNYTWNFNFLQKIGEGLQLNMVYEGRNSEGLKRIVHIGRMQVSALF